MRTKHKKWHTVISSVHVQSSIYQPLVGFWLGRSIREQTRRQPAKRMHNNIHTHQHEYRYIKNYQSRLAGRSPWISRRGGPSQQQQANKHVHAQISTEMSLADNCNRFHRFHPGVAGYFLKQKNQKIFGWTGEAKMAGEATGLPSDVLIPLTIEEIPACLIENMGLLEVTDKFNGSVGTLKRMVEQGRAKLPSEGVSIRSKRLSDAKGSDVYFMVKQSQMRRHQQRLSSAQMIGNNAMIFWSSTH